MTARRWHLISLVLIMLCVSAACQAKDANHNVKTYDNDGYLGMTNTNPNLPGTPSYHNYNRDLELMRKTLNQIEEVHNASVFINGPVVQVNLNLPASLPAEEWDRIETEAYEALSYMMPRYQVEITGGLKRGSQ